MDKKEFSKNDVSVVKKSETIDENQLEGITGGIADAATACTCDCLAGNSNKSQPTKEQSTELQS